MKLQYKSNRDFAVTVGVTSFVLMEGSVVHVIQLDSTYNKVLVDYGVGMMDWMSASLFHNVFDKVGE